AAVGKTSLIRRYCEGKFEQSRVMTIGVDFQTQTVRLGDQPVRLSIWDVAGQERFGSFRSGFYMGARAVALVYDVTEAESFAHLVRWRDEIRQIVPAVPLTVIANKVDLAAAVEERAARRWAASQGMPFLTTSAATGLHVGQLFAGLAHLAVSFRGNL
ncbi:MAG: GTP-binding protein, partial [Anaerolineae bacterium]|nr:GTP-binding protein [Anaerolineae bacterium]